MYSSGVQKPIFRTGGATNHARYSNPQVDAQLDAAVSTTDPAAAAGAYQQAQLLIARDLPVAWLSRSYTATITRKNVHGIVRYLPGEVFWSATWLAP